MYVLENLKTQKYELLNEITETMDVVETIVNNIVQNANSRDAEVLNEQIFGVFLLLHSFFKRFDERLESGSYEFKLISQPEQIDWKRTIEAATQ